MVISKKLPIGCTLLAAGLALAAASLPAQADIVLSIDTPTENGVFAATLTTAAFAPATENPARAVVNGAHASMRQLGSQIIFSANLNGPAGDNVIASTGAGSSPNDGQFAAIGVQIVGTAGEADGTPVSIALHSGYSGSGNIIITQIANQTNYPINALSTISGLKVGDTFDFWSMLNGHDTVNATLTTTLTVSASPAAAVPEPGVGGLMGAGGVVLGGFGLRRKRSRR